jgi:putative colanic acid biosynthesis glycosyltransferase
MAESYPLSVIVVCKNPGRALQAALESVWNQRDVSVDLVVVDGSSTDGSREWLDGQRTRISTLISESDTGVYDAMNKGIAAAKGEWIFFLGSDDRLANDSVLSSALIEMKHTKACVLAGEAVYADGRIYRLRPQAHPIVRNFVHHQAAFYHRTSFEKNGNFDTSLALLADYDLNVRLWRNRVSFAPIPLRIAICGTGGVSDRGSWRGYREEIIVRHRYFPSYRCYMWDAVSVLRFLRKQMVRRSSSSHG